MGGKYVGQMWQGSQHVVCGRYTYLHMEHLSGSHWSLRGRAPLHEQGGHVEVHYDHKMETQARVMTVACR
jgi:hypothetical protein